MATRSSKLAIHQTNTIVKLLKNQSKENEFRVELITTKGDKDKRPFFAIDQNGVFEKEVNECLLQYKADFAVHSLKDLHAGFSDKLIIASIPKREKPYDVFINNINNKKISELETGSIIGTSSIRRAIQIKTKYPSILIKSIRGNIEKRISKSKEKNYTGIVLAEAGLKRLGFDKIITQRLNYQTFIPAPGQGAIAIVCRKDDPNMIKTLKKIENQSSRNEIEAERALTDSIGAGCTVPLGALAITNKENNKISLIAAVYSLDGKRSIKLKEIGNAETPKKLGKKMADQLISKGAKEITIEWSKKDISKETDIIKGIIIE
ncbi:MAG: hydroxymethylbilane synthase [Candidatus Nitrosocosmicus sp.]